MFPISALYERLYNATIYGLYKQPFDNLLNGICTSLKAGDEVDRMIAQYLDPNPETRLTVSQMNNKLNRLSSLTPDLDTIT